MPLLDIPYVLVDNPPPGFLKSKSIGLLNKTYDPILYNKLKDTVKTMQSKATQFGDVNVALNKLREAYENGTDAKDVMSQLNLYNKMMNLPWKPDSIPPAYKTGSAGASSDAYASIVPEYHEMYVENPSLPVYLHEKGHQMQFSPGLVSDYYDKLLKKSNSNRDIDRSVTPYKQRIMENEANKFSDFVTDFMTKGVDVNNPYLGLLRDWQDRPVLTTHSMLLR